MLLSLWESALCVSFTVEVSFTCWFHCGSQLYMLVSLWESALQGVNSLWELALCVSFQLYIFVSLWKSALHVSFTVEVSFTC